MTAPTPGSPKDIDPELVNQVAEAFESDVRMFLLSTGVPERQYAAMTINFDQIRVIMAKRAIRIVERYHGIASPTSKSAD